MHNTRLRLAVCTAAGLGILGLAAACGNGAQTASGGSQYQPASAPAGGQGASFTSTVSSTTINGAKVLVDPTGAALYTNDQDTGGKPKCVTSDCVAVWVPLTVPAGQQPTAGPGVGGSIGTVSVGGKDQVTLNGKPLYTFALDGRGESHGNGLQDSFGGTHFSWHSAVPAGAAPASPSSAAPIPGY